MSASSAVQALSAILTAPGSGGFKVGHGKGEVEGSEGQKVTLVPRPLGTTAAVVRGQTDVRQGFALTSSRRLSCSSAGWQQPLTSRSLHQPFSPHRSQSRTSLAGRAGVNPGSWFSCTPWSSFSTGKEFRLLCFYRRPIAKSFTEASMGEGLWGSPEVSLLLSRANTGVGKLHVNKKPPYTSAMQKISSQRSIYKTHVTLQS